MIKVFVYGTLKPDGKYYPIHCLGKTFQEIKCWTMGRLYALPLGYPAMILGTSGSDDRVYGYLLSFASEKDLANLDKLEGYSGISNSTLNEYERTKIIVYNEANQAIEGVWTYFMTPEKVKALKGVYLPCGQWQN
jgi:gamma-glutamylcyclotransferase (GGCT)/AIG2-like uncharacterized protein YtfP